MSKDIVLPLDKVKHLFDLVIGSMDFGSGFLDDDDVDLLREIARWIGVSPDVATPTDWRHKYPHPFQRTGGGRCSHCLRSQDMPCHGRDTGG